MSTATTTLTSTNWAMRTNTTKYTGAMMGDTQQFFTHLSLLSQPSRSVSCGENWIMILRYRYSTLLGLSVDLSICVSICQYHFHAIQSSIVYIYEHFSKWNFTNISNMLNNSCWFFKNCKPGPSWPPCSGPLDIRDEYLPNPIAMKMHENLISYLYILRSLWSKYQASI